MVTSEVIRIDSLAFGGDGVGRIAGKVCFVPFGVPGDLLSVRIIASEKSYTRGEILEVIEPSPARRAARCRHFGRCGGCQWQHIDYARQLSEKQRILAETMQRFAHLGPRILPVVPSEEEYEYRNRARLRVLDTGEIGYFARSSNDLVAVEECPILAPPLEQQLRELRRSTGYRRLAETGTRGSRAGAGPSPPPAQEIELSLRPSGAVSERLVERLPADHHGSRRLRGRHATRGRHIPIGKDAYSFHQVNRFVNAELARKVRETVLQRCPDDRALSVTDLYCGNGNLSLALADRAARITGFDTSDESIREASMSARLSGISNAAYYVRDAGTGLDELGRSPSMPLPPYRCIIADPPREGLRALAEQLAAVRPELLIYVSCNPPALARDARLLVERGLHLDFLQPFDMFPQTFHLETMAVFTGSPSEAGDASAQ